jgi:hypothetical protein
VSQFHKRREEDFSIRKKIRFLHPKSGILPSQQHDKTTDGIPDAHTWNNMD